MNPEVHKYRQYLEQLSYPEYAGNHETTGTGASYLDLSLWNDELPPGIAEAIQHALPTGVGSYCFAQDPELKSTLSTKLGTAAEAIIITGGADGALALAAQYCLRPKAKAAIPTPCFGRYTYHALVQQATICYINFDKYPYEFDVGRICAEVRKQNAACLILASPNNPTGHQLRREDIKQLLVSVSCSVILDESLLLDVEESAAALVAMHDNLFVCGSFSKLYGLAGLRIGYLVAHPTHVAPLVKLVSPFGVDALAIAAAKHIMKQEKWLWQRIATMRDSIIVLQDTNNPCLRTTRTNAPVALIEYSGVEGKLHDLLQARGIMTVPSSDFPGIEKTNAVRVIIKDVKDMLQLTKVMATLS